MTRYCLTFFVVVACMAATAQNATEPQMADGFREDGKIRVVIAVIAIIFVALLVFLLLLERKLSRIEKRINEKN